MDVKPSENEAALLAQMTQPDDATRQAVKQLDGDIMVLGAAGKMGPTLCELLLRGGAKRVIGVSRFSNIEMRQHLDQIGVETISANVLDDTALAALPEVPYIFLLAGFKFGASGNQSMTWAMNAWMPGRILQRFPQARIIYVSSGNVYPFTVVTGAGAREDDPVGPVGEYAQSRLGGERIAAHFAQEQGTPLLIVRLFYATELRYGIIHDIAWKVAHGTPIDLSMGYVNQIWQGDANAYLARMFPLCQSSAPTINLTGADVLSVEWIAQEVGKALGLTPYFSGTAATTALLGDASRLLGELGMPKVASEQIIAWMVEWIKRDGVSLGKPTKFESRSGDF